MGNANSKCPVDVGQNTLYEHGTAQSALYIVAGICALITLLSSVGLMLMHLKRYRAPREQRQIMKILFTPFVVALIAWLCVSNYHAALYIQPLGELYAAFCLTAVYLLYIQFVAPESEYGDDMFEAMHNATDKQVKSDKDNWAKASWVSVFQLPITFTLSVIIQEATQATGTYCADSLRPRFGHLWVMILRTLGLVVCIMAIVRFYKRAKSLMQVRRAIAKLFCFKVIVAVGVIQTWTFNILLDHNVLKPSEQFSEGDWTYGVPSALLAAEMVIFSASFWYAYSPSEYSSQAKPQTQPLNIFRATLDAINPSDILLGIVRGIALLFNRYEDPEHGR